MVGIVIKSPCENLCNAPLKTDGICSNSLGKGCYRSIQEGEEWIRASDRRKVIILDNCKERRKMAEESEITKLKAQNAELRYIITQKDNILRQILSEANRTSTVIVGLIEVSLNNSPKFGYGGQING